MAEHTKEFILRQLGHLDNQDPPFSVLSSRRVWLYRDKYAEIISDFITLESYRISSSCQCVAEHEYGQKY